MYFVCCEIMFNSNHGHLAAMKSTDPCLFNSTAFLLYNFDECVINNSRPPWKAFPVMP
jgi:hypothetical protein